ncbi:DNA alkylation repair protein [Cohnella phaseoli]|uniref:3-methyladenine DNA glycosylase AlkC n=1 Tax=Cohnella phaseoli TaxID=456490 RepID=A0A3D9HTK4_9BACL|nr:DNA alkylation repair protein [Cohnella phaseoli]RED52843.1 3-methyladenine DNA glycosylase AlkC [Cohnella phaseoli]
MEQQLEAASLANRKGARKVNDIPAEVMKLLQSGELETVNLTEWLAIDHRLLLEHVACELELDPYIEELLAKLPISGEKKIMTVIPKIAQAWLILLDRLPDERGRAIFGKLSSHRSDSVRCWAAYIVGLQQHSLERRLALIRPFAADRHFGVRELAWMAVRESAARELNKAILLLQAWTQDEDANLRRFSVEVIRPRGVWAKHIPELKNDPSLALPLLEPLKSDPSKYVQDSVANWLNDAGKTQPEWVVELCRAWFAASDTKMTKRIVTRAQRSMNPSTSSN